MHFSFCVSKHFIFFYSLHKKWSSPLRISSENVTKCAKNCGFGHIYWKKFLMGNFIFVQRFFRTYGNVLEAEGDLWKRFSEKSCKILYWITNIEFSMQLSSKSLGKNGKRLIKRKLQLRMLLIVIILEIKIACNQVMRKNFVISILWRLLPRPLTLRRRKTCDLHFYILQYFVFLSKLGLIFGCCTANKFSEITCIFFNSLRKSAVAKS